MAFDLSLVGKPSEPSTFDYTWKDASLYALGIGAKAEELDYLFEGKPPRGEASGEGPLVYPSFAVVPAYAPMIGLLARSGGNLAMVVHGGQKVRMHRPLPPEGSLRTTATIRGIYDIKKFASIITDTHTVDAKTGEPLFDTTWTIIFRGEGSFGGSPPPKDEPIVIPAGAAPDFSVREPTSKEQALLYRLSGDLNPLHADPAFAAAAGFTQGPILHGLCTYGHMVRHVVKSLCDGDARKLKGFDGQFKRPVWPGDVLVTNGWKIGDNRWALQVAVENREGEVVIGNAQALL
ncbi:MAG: MaoC family dehydratase N-terminal domain-containing protein [Myxococcales bacterium]|nr:MaoC family dehydratase N-terminal domain-containing protein [Myxococcales bacterium]